MVVSRRLPWFDGKSAPRDGRWAIVAAVSVALIALGQLGWAETTRPPELSLRARRDEGRIVVAWVQPGGPGWDAGIRPGDSIVEADGRAVAPTDDPEAIAQTPALTVRGREGGVVTADATPAVLATVLHRAAFLALAALFAAVGGAVYILAADLAAVRSIFTFTVATAAMFAAAIATPFGAKWALIAEYLTVIGFGTTALLLALIFPIDRCWRAVGRLIAGASVATATTLAIVYGWTVLVDPAGYAILLPVTYATVAAELIGAIVLFGLGFATGGPRGREARAALTLVTLGAGGGFLPFCLLALGPRLLGLGSLVPPDIAILAVGLLPVGLGAAVLAPRFHGIARVARRGLVALTVWLALLAAYGIGFGFLRRLAGAGGGGSPPRSTRRCSASPSSPQASRLCRRACDAPWSGGSSVISTITRRRSRGSVTRSCG
jgi:membrane-associated protease RseP (regulator of RpoE activity)